MLHPPRPSGAILLFLIIWLLCILAFSGLALLLGSAVFGMEVVSAGAAAVDLPGGLSWLRTGQLINQVGVFFVPSFITALALYGRRGAAAALRLQTRTPAIPWLTALLLLPMALPALNVVIEWNASLDLPAALDGMEGWMRKQEAQATALSDAFLSDMGPTSLLLNILIMALIPGLGEELLFRGTLQPLLIRWTRSSHLGVTLSAIAFSALHLQFFGFFPRMLLGLLLGYAFLWTRNLWVPVLMHTLNNLAVVLVYWLHARGTITQDPETLSLPFEGWFVAFSLMLTFLGLRMLWQRRQTTPGDGTV